MSKTIGDADVAELAPDQERLATNVGHFWREAASGASWRQSLQAQRFLLVEGSGAKAARRASLSSRVVAFAATAVLLGSVAAVSIHELNSATPAASALSISANDGQEVVLGRPIVASQALELHTGEGTTLALASGSEAKIVAATDALATVELTHGELKCELANQSQVAWDFIVAGYRITAKSGRFDLDLAPGGKGVRVRVAEGQVHVAGGSLGSAGVDVAQGNAVEFTLAGAQVAGFLQLAEPAAGAEAPREPSAAELSPQSAEANAKPAGRAAGSEGAVSSWKALLQKGDYAGALAAAKEPGVEQILAREKAWDVVAFSDVARLAGDRALAKQALLRVRTRFPGTTAAQQAGFTLGKIALENEGALGEAARWFRTYLREAGPNAALAQNAEERLMVTLLQLGDKPGARGVAEGYIKSHPNGRHVDAAKKLLNSSP